MLCGARRDDNFINYLNDNSIHVYRFLKPLDSDLFIYLQFDILAKLIWEVQGRIEFLQSFP